MKKLKYIACITAFALLLGGCDLGQFLPTASNAPATSTPAPETVEYDKYLDEYRDNWQYRYLSKPHQARYGAIYTVLTDSFAADDTVTVGTQTQTGVRIPLPTPLSSQEEATDLYNAFFRDNPQFFYIGSSYGLEGYMQDEIACYDTLLLVYTMDAATRATAREQLNTVATQLVAECPDIGDDYFVELQLHDRLAALCSYADEAAIDGGYEVHPNAYNAYGALVEGKAVCEGYARAMQLLLGLADIPSTLVIGRSLENGQEHMWNMVTVNGQNYHVDPTWNDSDDRLRHSFFNLSTALLERTHTIDDGQTGIDTCTAEDDNYFIRNRTYFDTYERDIIAEHIAAAFMTGETVIELRFAPNKYDNAVLFLKNHSLTKSKVALFLPNGSELWEYQLYGENEQCVLTLVKDE